MIIDGSKAAVLRELVNGFEKPASIAARMAISPSTVMKDLRQLVAAGLVQRAGRGGVLYGLTDAGTQQIGATPAAPIRNGIDYDRVLEDLRERRAQLDAAITAIESLR